MSIFGESMGIKIKEVKYMSWDSSYVDVAGRPYAALAFRVSGSARFFDGKLNIKTNKGDVLYMPSNCAYKAAYKEKNEILVIHFETDIISNMENFSVSNHHILSMLFYKLLDIWNKKEFGYYYDAMSIMCEILKNISSQQQFALYNETTKSFEKALNYMEQNYTDSTISIKDIVEKSNMSNTYFNKLFCNRFNTTPVKYLILKRIMYADKLLSTGRYSVKQVAEMAGFNDVKYFSRVVKHEYGVPPSKLYRHIKNCNVL